MEDAKSLSLSLSVSLSSTQKVLSAKKLSSSGSVQSAFGPVRTQNLTFSLYPAHRFMRHESAITVLTVLWRICLQICSLGNFVWRTLLYRIARVAKT